MEKISLTLLALLVAVMLICVFNNPQFALAGQGHDQTPAPAKQQLHRVDFRVVGSSCVVCLRRIGKGLRDTKGVLKADVSIFSPYWGIVVYDGSQTTYSALEDALRKEKVKLEEVEDKPIAEMPALLIPKTTPADDKAKTTLAPTESKSK